MLVPVFRTHVVPILLFPSYCLALGRHFGRESRQAPAYDLSPTVADEETRFGEVDIPLGDATRGFWTQAPVDASMYSQINQPVHFSPSPSYPQDHPLLPQYAPPPTNTGSGYTPIGYPTQDVSQALYYPQQQVLAHHQHEEQLEEPVSLANKYPMDMNVAGESGPVSRIRMGRDGSTSASSSRTRGARARARSQSWARQLEDVAEDEEGNESEEGERDRVKQSQSARVHQNRSQFVKEVILPSAPSTARDSSVMSPARQAAAMRHWVQQEWARRGVDENMPAQRLAQEVAKMKIVNPLISKSIGRASLTIAERVRGQEPWFTYDIYSWTETYKQRINYLRGKYLLEGRYSEEQIQQRQLDNVLSVAPTHYATLADPAEEAAEVATAGEVWAEFFVVQLGTLLTEEGPSFPLELLANRSWNWRAREHNEAMSRKFINKYLRCVLHWSLSQLEQLETLQLALETQSPLQRVPVRAAAPRARRGRRA